MIELTGEDYKIFESIEKVREKIIQENRQIEFVDYGAGTPTSTRTDSEMYSGVKSISSTGKMCKIGLKKNWAELIYKIVKKHKPNQILELGTCCGFSSIYMSKANKLSNIVTLDGSKELAKIAKKNMELLDCSNIVQKIGRFQDILTDVLNQIKQVDLAFIDGHHDKNATIKYYNMIRPYLSKNAIIIFDDISWSEGMKEAWNEISKDKNIAEYENLDKLGICYLYSL